MGCAPHLIQNEVPSRAQSQNDKSGSATAPEPVYADAHEEKKENQGMSKYAAIIKGTSEEIVTHWLIDDIRQHRSQERQPIVYRSGNRAKSGKEKATLGKSLIQSQPKARSDPDMTKQQHEPIINRGHTLMEAHIFLFRPWMFSANNTPRRCCPDLRDKRLGQGTFPKDKAS